MTRESLGERTGVATSTIVKHEKDGIGSIQSLLKYAEALGCKPSDLLEETIDVEAYTLSEDISSFYPWNLALKILCPSLSTMYKEVTDEDRKKVNKVYAPALLEALTRLNEREQRVIELIYLHGMTLEQSGYRLNVTRERIRQVEQTALRKLRNPSLSRKFILDTMDKAHMINEQKNALERENVELKKILIKLGYTFSEEYKPIPPKIPLIDLGLSVRSHNCLSRAGIKYVSDLNGMTLEKLKKVRNLGMKSCLEVIEKAREYGVEIPMGEGSD